MEFKRLLECGLALLPAMLCLLVCIIANWISLNGTQRPRLFANQFMHSHEKVHWLKEVIVHLSTSGTVIGGAFGLTKGSFIDALLVMLWLTVMLTVSYKLTCVLAKIDKIDDLK